jgi:hypothetical protein|eukprot:SAG25_NODE_790_length_5301_cov_2.342176_7_plen_107_part_00
MIARCRSVQQAHYRSDGPNTTSVSMSKRGETPSRVRTSDSRRFAASNQHTTGDVQLDADKAVAERAKRLTNNHLRFQLNEKIAELKGCVPFLRLMSSSVLCTWVQM